jgi:O-antigen/teichoic acid export membrane protein
LFSANSLMQLVEFGSQLFLTWILIADDIGRIKSFQSFAAIAVVASGFGFNTSVLKLCSEKKTSLKEKQSLFSSAIKVTLVGSALVLFIIFILSFFGLLSNDDVVNKLFVYYALSVPLLALNNLMIAYYQALKAFKKVSLLLVFARVLHVSIIISLTFLFGLTGFVFGIVIGFLISTVLLFSKMEFLDGWKETTREHYKRNWELAKYAFLGNGVNIITLYLDIFLLNHFINEPEEFGYYGFALTLISGLRLVTNTAQQFVTPFFSEFSSNYVQSIRAFKRANMIFTSVICLVGFLAILITPLLIPLMDSGKYDSSIYYFQALTIAWIIRSLVSLKGPFLLAYGYMNVNFYSILIVLGISVVPIWYFVSEYGIQGAVYGQLFTAVIFFTVATFNFNRILKRLVNKQS